MITEKDLQEAIAECEGERNPNSNTCMKLAAFYIIKREMFGDPPVQTEEFPRGLSGFSRDAQITYDSGTEFSDLVREKDFDDIMPLMDELMESVKVVVPRLYNSVITRLHDV